MIKRVAIVAGGRIEIKIAVTPIGAFECAANEFHGLTPVATCCHPYRGFLLPPLLFQNLRPV